MWVQLQITKYCITNITAQLLLSKHRHSKKPTDAKSQQVTSQGYLQSKDIDKILIIYFLFEIYLQVQNSKRYKSFVSEQQRKGRKTVKFIHFLKKKGTKFTQIYQNPTKCWPIGMRQSYSSEFRTFRLKCKYSKSLNF